MSFKTLDLANDVSSVLSAINEVVQVSSSIYAKNANVQFYRNIVSASAGPGFDLGGYWETVFDSSPTSSFSTALFDMTYGYSTGSVYNVPATATSSQNQKVKIYRSLASVLLGDPDSIFTIDQTQQTECFFVMVKRGIQKDEIKKGATQMIVNDQFTITGRNTGSLVPSFTASDQGAASTFQQSVGGDYAPLLYNGTGSEVGQVWYNAGIIVLAPQLLWDPRIPWSGSTNLSNMQFSASIGQLVDGLRAGSAGVVGGPSVLAGYSASASPPIDSLFLNNQTNLYSTAYFCRALNSEFNYSSNPTFTDDSQRIIVTSGSNILQTRTYITTIGLYDPNDNLLAVAKVNKPITKSPDNECVLRIRLDF